jgi:hypothetical protein
MAAAGQLSINRPNRTRRLSQRHQTRPNVSRRRHQPLHVRFPCPVLSSSSRFFSVAAQHTFTIKPCVVGLKLRRLRRLSQDSQPKCQRPGCSAPPLTLLRRCIIHSPSASSAESALHQTPCLRRPFTAAPPRGTHRRHLLPVVP